MNRKRMKISILIFILMMTVGSVLSGCGDKEEEIAGTIQQEGDTELTEEEEKDLSLGKFEGGIYTNKYLGITCTLDDNWTFASAKELQELPEDVASAMEGTELGDSLAEVDQLMDMQAENLVDLTQINIVYTKVDLKERVFAKTAGEEAILDSVMEQAELMKEGYNAAGIEVREMKKVKVTFLGEERYGMYTNAVTEGIEYFTLQLFDYSAGEYSATITFASYVEDKTEELLKLFSEIE